MERIKIGQKVFYKGIRGVTAPALSFIESIEPITGKPERTISEVDRSQSHMFVYILQNGNTAIDRQLQMI